MLKLTQHSGTILLARALLLGVVVTALNAPPLAKPTMAPRSTIVWFRKGLRVHDNLALLDAALEGGTALFPL